VAKAHWLAPGGWMAVETQKGESVTTPDDWKIDVTRDVGRARLTLLKRLG
jgi:16S rRNA (guanine966-N2)-methyltransferase